MVTVDGHDVRIRTAAPHPDRIPGRPLVVLEAGFGSTVDSWGPFIEQIAGFASVLAYERPGIGESEWDGEVPTFEHIAGRLRRLLKEVGAEPPYVLVGHSFGGDLVRFFADFHPEETAGLVLLDPVTNNADDFLAALVEIGAGEEEYWEVRAWTADADLPPGARAEDQMLNRFALHGEELELPRPTHLPVSILFAGLDVPPEGQHDFPFHVGRHVQTLERRKIALLGEWIMQVPEGEMTVIPSSGHFVHRDEPDLALEAVRRVVYPDLSRALLRALDAGGPDAAVAVYRERKEWYPPHRFWRNRWATGGWRRIGESWGR